MEKCKFDENGTCMALVCYSSQKCNSRDKNGSPMYATLEKIKSNTKAQ